MTFKELEKLVLSHGFQFMRAGKGSARFYFNPETGRTTKIDFHGSREVPLGTCKAILKQAGLKGNEK